MPEPVVLIDCMNTIFRNHYAHRHLKDEQGRPTGVLHGVLKTVADLRENVSKRLVICWDHGVPVYGAAKPRNWRDDVLKGYKAGRTREEDSWRSICSQLPDLHRALSLLGYQHVAVMGLEADDVIGILSRELTSEILIFSTDKDFYQLLSIPDVEVLVPKKDKGEFLRITAADVESKYKIPVTRWAEYLALGGDNSDNIKPMKGMGPKTAIKLIQSGCDLREGFQCQPAGFIEKYGPAWADIQRSYSAARLPVSRKDPRVVKLIGTLRAELTDLEISGHQAWGSAGMEALSKKKFVEFCADRNLNQILNLRHQLFNTESKHEVISQVGKTDRKRSTGNNRNSPVQQI